MFKTMQALAAVGAVAVGIAGPAMAVAQGRITLGTNPQGSLYYTIGGGIAAALQDRLGRPVTVQPFTGSSVYIPLIDAGEVTLGLNSAIDVGFWYRGEQGTQPLEGLRVLARLWPLRQAFITRTQDGMRTVADLEGRRVVVDFAALAAVTEVNVATLGAAGLSTDDLESVSVSGLAAGLEALTEGSVDATSAAIGIPLTQQANASISGGITYLGLEDEAAAAAYFDENLPGVYPLLVEPTPTMPEITEPVMISAYDIFLTVSADLPDAEATEILTALYEAFPQLRDDYPALRGGAQEDMAMDTNTVPYHPAAVAFFTENGLWTEENDATQASILE